MTRSIEVAEAAAFEAGFAPWIGATIADKGNLESKGIAFLLDLFKIQDSTDFLTATETTLGTIIYVPEEMSPNQRVDVIVHGGKHVGQYAPKPDVAYGPVLDAAQRAALEAGAMTPWIADVLKRLRIDESRIRPHGFGFMWLYLTQPEERAVYEAHAYATSMQFRKQRWGDLLPLEHFVERLRHGYALEAQHVATAAKILEVRRSEIAAGVYRDAVANKAIEILKGISPELVIPGV